MRRKADIDPASTGSWINRRQVWVPIFMMVGISLLSGSAGVQVGPLSFVGIDKLGHLVVFGLLGIAWARCLRSGSLSAGQRLILATFLATGFGMLDELHQYTNPARYFEWADLGADFAGSLLAAALYLYFKPLQRVLEINFRYRGRLKSSR